MPVLKDVKRCPAINCDSPIFYDWGLQVLGNTSAPSVTGGEIDKYKDFASTNNVIICARCNTPYIIEGGKLIDISDELGPEDVKAIISRGQTNLPHPKIKDP